ncbi:MAG: ATP-binding protein [Planctomycetota bacterium]
MLHLKSRNAAFAAYGVLLVLPTLVFGGMYWRQLVRDYELQLDAAPDAAVGTAKQVADALRQQVASLLAQEAKRPFAQYAELFSPGDDLSDELAVQGTPLEREPTPEGILGWFSYDRFQFPSGPVLAFFGSDRQGEVDDDLRADLERAAITFRDLKEEEGPANRATQMIGHQSQLVPSRVVAVYLNQEENRDCLEDCFDFMRDWEIDLDTSDFYLQLYRDTDNRPRAVAIRRVLMGVELNPDAPSKAECLLPLREGLALIQGFYIDIDWLLHDLVRQVGDQEIVRESERLIEPGVSREADEDCEVCTDVFPLRELGFDTYDASDSELGRVQIAVNTELIHERFKRQRTIFGGLALMMVLALMTGMMLIERTVRRDLEQAERNQNFVSAVTHELRTPLASIRLYGEMLLEGWTDDPAKIREYHHRILRETNRLSTMVERVLQKGRLVSRPSTCEAVDLNTMVEGLREALSAAHPPDDRWREGNDDLHFDLAPDLPKVLASLEVVAGVLTNLVENARKYAPWDPETPDGDRIQIRTAREGRRVVLEVLDSGPGIPAGERDRVFEAFYRLGNEATRTATGTGLGLHLVQLHAESVGAEAVVRPRPEGGSCFRIRFRVAT